jgi:hypothetical protein
MQQFTSFTFVESSTCSSWCVSNEVFLSEKALNTFKMQAKMIKFIFVYLNTIIKMEVNVKENWK